MFCTKCGAKLTEEAKFCIHCGTPVGIPIPANIVQEPTTEPAAEVPEVEPAGVLAQAGSIPAAEPVAEEPAENPSVPADEVVTDTPAEEPVSAPEVEAPVEEPPVEEPEEVPVEQIPLTEEPQEVCANCGAALKGNKKFCVHCGAPVAVPVLPVEAPETVQPATNIKKGKKGLIIAIVAVLVVALLGVGGFFGYRYYADTKDYDRAMTLLDEKDFDGALAAFQELGGFRDSKEQAARLQQLQTDYDAALEMLRNGEFNDARTVFEELDDYRDSKEYVQFGVAYAEACYYQENATSADAYLDAADAFTSLGQYKDSADQASNCCLCAARILLKQGEAKNALALMDSMNEADAELFYSEYQDQYADGAILKAWAEALRVRMETDDVSKEKALLDEYVDAPYADRDLQSLFLTYISALETQISVMEDGTVTDMIAWLKADLIRCQVLDEMNAEYGFLSDDEELMACFVGQAQYTQTLIDIETAINAQLIGVSAQGDSANGYYLTFVNNAAGSFTLKFNNYFYDGDSLVDTDSQEVFVGVNQTVKIPILFPADSVEWDSWEVDYEYYGVQVISSSIVAGDYSLSFAFIDGVYCDDRDELVAILGGEAGVTINTDGTAVMTLGGENEDLQYSDGMIWPAGNKDDAVSIYMEEEMLVMGNEELLLYFACLV